MMLLYIYVNVAAAATLNSSSNVSYVSTSPITPPASRAIMSSPFTLLQGRPEHAFAHIHPQSHQVSFPPLVSTIDALVHMSHTTPLERTMIDANCQQNK